MADEQQQGGGVTPPPPTPTPTPPPAFTLDTPFDVNLVPEDQRAFFTERKVGKFGDLVANYLDAEKRASTPQKFGRDSKLDLTAFDENYQKIFGAKKLETVGALADQVVSAEKLIGTLGTNPIARPTPGKLGEWLANNAEAMGKPAKPEDYAWNKPKMPENVPFDDALESEFRKFAHERHIPNEMFQDMADFGANLLIRQNQQAQAHLDKDIADNEAALITEWGADTQKNKEIALFAARNLGLDGKMIDRLSQENGSAETLRLLQRIGAKMEGASLITGDGSTIGNAQSAAVANLEKFERDPIKQKAFTDASDPGHAAAVEEHTKLMAQIHS